MCISIIEKETLQRVPDYVNVYSADNAIAQFTAKMPWPMRRFYLNKFYMDR